VTARRQLASVSVGVAGFGLSTPIGARNTWKRGHAGGSGDGWLWSDRRLTNGFSGRQRAPLKTALSAMLAPVAAAG
jgi:hypothetical protein